MFRHIHCRFGQRWPLLTSYRYDFIGIANSIHSQQHMNYCSRRVAYYFIPYLAECTVERERAGWHSGKQSTVRSEGERTETEGVELDEVIQF